MTQVVILRIHFLTLGFTPCKAEKLLQVMELQAREAQKRLKHTGNLFRKNLQLKMSVNSGLKATYIIVQRKASYWQRIP